MESTLEAKISEKVVRKKAMEQWLASVCRLEPDSLALMTGDASFRRYFRLHAKQQSYVVMDAPPQLENCRPFIAISKTLRNMGLHTPEVIHADPEKGFLLLTDFGDATYLRTLMPENMDHLYGIALDALTNLQACRYVEGYIIPPFTADFMRQEWAWHKDWVWCKWLGLSLPLAEPELDACYELLVNSAISQPQVFMHRDYHSANLMVLPNNEVGILDFQDAFIGPVTYDLASLLRDCYIDWPREKVIALAVSYLQRLQERGELAGISSEVFLRWFDWMGMQRHLKAMLTFARKQVRDHQSRYLRYMPRALNYLIQVSHHYPELTRLHDYLRITIQPAMERVNK